MGPAMRMRLGMMLWGWLLLLAGLLGGMVPLASSAQTGPALRPAEEPPSDFAGIQYIDSHGCVFTRDGKLWAARVGRDGVQVCGYPPTPVGTVIRPQLPPALEGMGRIEAELVHAITANLAPGDLVTDPRPSAPASDLPVAGPQGGGGQAASVVTQIQGALSATGPIRIAVAGTTAPGRRLCASLGLDETASHRSSLGDATAGLCSTPLPQTSPLRSAEAEAGAAAAVAARSGADGASARIRVSAEGHKGHPQKNGTGPAKPKASAVAIATRPTAIRQSSSVTHKDTHKNQSPATMIPARARYLELTGVSSATDAVLARLHALGLPASRARMAGSAIPILLAGPFHSRQSIVSAYDQLTRAGFHRIRAR